MYLPGDPTKAARLHTLECPTRHRSGCELSESWSALRWTTMAAARAYAEERHLRLEPCRRCLHPRGRGLMTDLLEYLKTGVATGAFGRDA
jgi:hypothetical protein